MVKLDKTLWYQSGKLGFYSAMARPLLHLITRLSYPTTTFSSQVSLHHQIDRIVVLSMIVNLLTTFEQRHPIWIQLVILHSILDIVCTSFVERCAAVVARNTTCISMHVLLIQRSFFGP